MPVPIFQCKHCGTLGPSLAVDEPGFQAVVQALCNGSQRLATAELENFVQCQDTEAQTWIEHLLACAYAWPVAENDRLILLSLDHAFEDVLKPEHFTDFSHCFECKEHDDTLCARTRDTLQRKDLGNSGWNPITFCKEEGIGYFFPVLARFALLPDAFPSHDWYGSLLLDNLSYEGDKNRFLGWCTPKQRDAVSAFLIHFSSTRVLDISNYLDNEDLKVALSAWK